jgi:hypothetical protein
MPALLASAASLPLDMALVTVAIPMGVVAVGGFVGWLLPKRWDGFRAAVLGLGLGAGIVAAYIGIAGQPSWPPVDAAGWLPFAVAAAAILFALSDMAPFPVAAAFALRLGLLGGLAWLLFRDPARFGEWSRTEWLRWAAAPAAAGAILWAIVAASARRVPTAASAAALLVALVGLSVPIVLFESAKMAQVTGGAAAATGAALLFAWLVPGLRFGQSAVAAAATMLFGMATYVLYYIDLPPLVAVLVVSGVFAGWGGVAWARMGRRPIAALLLAAILAAVPAAFAGWRAFAAQQQSAAPDADPWSAEAEDLYDF